MSALVRAKNEDMRQSAKDLKTFETKQSGTSAAQRPNHINYSNEVSAGIPTDCL
jgi:hypothetical protein